MPSAAGQRPAGSPQVPLDRSLAARHVLPEADVGAPLTRPILDLATAQNLLTWARYRRIDLSAQRLHELGIPAAMQLRLPALQDRTADLAAAFGTHRPIPQ